MASEAPSTPMDGRAQWPLTWKGLGLMRTGWVGSGLLSKVTGIQVSGDHLRSQSTQQSRGDRRVLMPTGTAGHSSTEWAWGYRLEGDIYYMWDFPLSNSCVSVF